MCVLPLVLALVLPASTTAPPRWHGQILACDTHSVWSEPKGWIATRGPAGIVAVSPDSASALVRTDVATGARLEPMRGAEALAARIAGHDVTWGAPVATIREDVRSIVVDGDAGPLHLRLRVLDAGYGRARVWIELAATADALAAIERALASEQPLVDHACACGTDCDRRHP
jgi:hypothetical protein